MTRPEGQDDALAASGQAANVTEPVEEGVPIAELLRLAESVHRSLEDYIAKHSQDGESKAKALNLIKWLNKKIKLVEREESFVVPPLYEIRVKRGYVWWMEFGFNIGYEFGGRHPGVILQRSSGIVWAIPVSSQRPTPEQMRQGIYVEIPVIKGRFEDIPRWVNVLTLMPVSEIRIDFSSASGYVSGSVLDQIREAMERRYPR